MLLRPATVEEEAEEEEEESSLSYDAALHNSSSASESFSSDSPSDESSVNILPPVTPTLPENELSHPHPAYNPDVMGLGITGLTKKNGEEWNGGLGVLGLDLADSQEDEYALRRPDPDSYSDDGDVDQFDEPDDEENDFDRAREFSLSRARSPSRVGFRSDSPDLDADFDPRDVISSMPARRRRGGVSKALLEEVLLTFSGPLPVVTEEDEEEEEEEEDLAMEFQVDITVPGTSPTYDMEWRVHFLTSIPECSREDEEIAEREVHLLMAELAARASANAEGFECFSGESIDPWLIDDLSM